MRLHHQSSEQPCDAVGDRAGEQLHEPPDARVLLDRKHRRRPHGIDDLGLDHAGRILDAVVVAQELRPRELLRKPRKLELGGIPGREVLLAAAEQRLAHERCAPHAPVRDPRDRMPCPGVDTPDGERRRQRQRAHHLGGAAEKREQLARLAARDRHLVHHAARRTGEQLLGALAEKSQRARLGRAAKARGDRQERGDLDRG